MLEKALQWTSLCNLHQIRQEIQKSGSSLGKSFNHQAHELFLMTGCATQNSPMHQTQMISLWMLFFFINDASGVCWVSNSCNNNVFHVGDGMMVSIMNGPVLLHQLFCLNVWCSCWNLLKLFFVSIETALFCTSLTVSFQAHLWINISGSSLDRQTLLSFPLGLFLLFLPQK